MVNHSRGIWWDESLSPVTGCMKISAGCKFCWAESMILRFRHLHPCDDDQYLERPFGKVKIYDHPQDPWIRRLKSWCKPRCKPRRIALSWLGDLFHKDVPDAFIKEVIDTIDGCYQHQFFLLTKRYERAASWIPGSNTHLGYTVCNGYDTQRLLVALKKHPPSGPYYLHFEPLLERVSIMSSVSWVVVGGENGPNARPMQPEWARQIRDQCQALRIPFYFKSWGKHVPKGEGSRTLDGTQHNDLGIL